MVTHLQSIAIFMKDRDAAVGFYREALGFEVTADVTDPKNRENRWLTIKPKAGETNLMVLKAPAAAAPNQSIPIVMATDDIEGDCERIRATGGRLYPAKRAGWGNAMETHFADPDGNAFMLVQTAPR